MTKESTYYQSVANYYDIDARNFQSRYEENSLLQRIRSSFQKEAHPYAGKNILEIGYGPGIDLMHFAEQFPESQVYGLDISPGMMEVAKSNVDSKDFKNVQLDVGSFEDIEARFPGVKFDLIYVFFGALNTVSNLAEAPEAFRKVLKPKGKLVLTFVNKWYALGIFKPLAKLKFKTAFRRLGKSWDGYSPQKKLASRCYSSKEILSIFSAYSLIKKRGYSIVYPAWYEFKKYINKSSSLEKKWNKDNSLQKGPCWNLGEYTLYIFKNLD